MSTRSASAASLPSERATEIAELIGGTRGEAGAHSSRAVRPGPASQLASKGGEVPTFQEFASRWFERQLVEGGSAGKGLAVKTREDLEWRLHRHLLPAFASRRIDEITIEDVDRYRVGKVRDEELAPSSINKTLTTLATILEVAVEYELIERNPAQGRRRRLRSSTPRRSWLDRSDHIVALLDGARELDQQARALRGQRRALLATLIFAGLRIGEALALSWRDVDLARGTIAVKIAKTNAGMRSVNILPVLHEELASYRAKLTSSDAALMFGTSTGRQHGATNIRRRVLARAVERANAERAVTGLEPLVEGLTPHSLRRTFASLLFAIGETPPYVMAQMGHTSANLTLSVYARQMLRRDGEPERLRALVEGTSGLSVNDHPPSRAGAWTGDQR
jgi:integrase